MSQISIRHFTKKCAEIPQELWNILKGPLKEFYAQGTERAFALLDLLPSRGLAVVGTRHPLPRSTQQTREAILALTGADLVIISGFARGIDGTAHRAALDAGLPTIAVLGTGLDVDYPTDHRELRREILARDGLIVTEYPLGMPAHAGNFIQRNRIIAAWSNATWVVEAAHRSGALNTANWAGDNHRALYATPCFPGDPTLAGNQRLIDDGHAQPFWGAHSLGKTWLELSGRGGRPRKEKLPPSLLFRTDDVGALATQVNALAARQSGALVQELLDWAIANDWLPQRFFSALEKSLRDGVLIDKNGLLLINP